MNDTLKFVYKRNGLCLCTNLESSLFFVSSVPDLSPKQNMSKQPVATSVVKGSFLQLPVKELDITG